MTPGTTARSLAALALLATRAASASDEGARGEGDGISFEAGGLLQIQTDTLSAPPGPPWRIRARRARPYAEMRVGSWFVGRVEPDFATSRVFFNDAYVRLRPDPRFAMTIGRSGRPFGVVDDVSARDILPIERGARMRGVRALDHYALLEEVAYAGRSFGVAAGGEFPGALGFTYTIGFYRGGVGEEDDRGGDIEQFAGRVTIEPARHARLGASLTNRNFGCDACARGETRRGTAFGADLLYGEFGERGPLALLAVSAGTLDPFSGAHFVSGQIWLAYRYGVASGPFVDVEPLLRVSHGRPEGERAKLGGTLVTPGLNLYLGAKHRWMIDLDLWIPRGVVPVASSLKTQLQLAL
ncbi:hypothetical protein [Polyangium spumosum]|uniref:Porin n=1 Tax=Polyangium spumosum TaxID=889282 RepID=A0A6N7Q1U4_9BACT|nr:hypothetical protein [Polyangium spumosum]MRG96575.1 hypothetical protein [Polyangium spumosum]